MKIKLFLRWLSLWLGLAVSVPAQTPAVEAPAKPATGPVAVAPPGPTGPVFVIPLKGEVGSAQFYFLRRALKEAQRAKASAVILDINTFGGRGDVLMEEMDMLMTANLPTYAYVNPNAISAGALVALAAKKIYMNPNGIIGASAAVNSDGTDLSKTMLEKASSMVVAKARGAAQANGHAADIAEAFIRPEAEVKRGSVTIDGSSTLLTLNAADAARFYDGKPLLAAGLATNLEELIRAEKLSGPVRYLEPSGLEWLAGWTAIAPLLIIGGIVGAYLELKAPGFGVPGIFSLACFALFFASNFVAGLTGMEAMVMFAIGMVLIIAEFFLFPGLIVPGLVGALLTLGAVLWAMVDHWPDEDGGWRMPSGRELEGPVLNLLLAFAGTAVAVALLAKYLPKTTLYRRLVLAGAVPAGVGVTVPLVNMSVAIGATGTAVTTLRPAGKAEIGGETHDVVTGGDFVPAGTAVRVVSADGMRVVVEPV